MYAIIKTGGKQYRVAPGDMLNVEKIDAEVGDKITLDAICIVDGKKVEADPKAAGATKVEAVVVEQFKDKKILVFKFKKRKNYKRLKGHRQNLTRIEIVAVGSEKAAPKPKKAAKADDAKETAPKAAAEKKATPKPKAAAEKKSTATKKATDKKSEKPAEDAAASEAETKE